MLKAPSIPTLKTILPVIPPPMPAMSVPLRPALSRPISLEQTKTKGIPTHVWKDTRGYHRKFKPEEKK